MKASMNSLTESQYEVIPVYFVVRYCSYGPETRTAPQDSERSV